MIETGGWDTHAQQRTRLGTQVLTDWPGLAPAALFPDSVGAHPIGGLARS